MVKSNNMKKTLKIIYCDGSSLGNPGPGGFAVLALDMERKKVWEYGGAQNPSTNNQMELSACLFALKLILKSFEQTGAKDFELRLDSKYVIQGATEWSKNWIKNNWKSANKKKVLNVELWKPIIDAKNEIDNNDINLKWTHVYGHTGEEHNERVDVIAKAFATGEKIILRKGESVA